MWELGVASGTNQVLLRDRRTSSELMGELQKDKGVQTKDSIGILSRSSLPVCS